MDLNQQYYKRVLGAIGCTMLIFEALFQIFGVLLGVISAVLDLTLTSTVAYNVAFQILYAAGYMTVFMLPVVFLRMILRKRGCPIQPMSLSSRFSPMLPLMIFAGVTVCFSMAQINSSILDLFGYSDVVGDMTVEQMRGMEPYEIVLNFIVISIVPGFCEEFLFRGAILSNCRPFGRANAILISSVLFALMHQNAAQILYTFAAGVVLGLVYEYTGSIWNCTLLHMLNNFISLAQEVILDKLGANDYGIAVLYLVETVIYLGGIVSIGVLVYRYFSQKDRLSDGAFGRVIPPHDAYAQYPVEGRVAAKLFFRPSMIVFVVLVAAQIGMTILLFSFIGVLT